MNKVTFAAMADLHTPIMHDCRERLEAFLSAARERDVDFIIQLGDFCFYPNQKKAASVSAETPVNVQQALEAPIPPHQHLLEHMFLKFEKPAYSCVGNHENDLFDKSDVLRHLKLERGYYSFDTGGIHFIVLDGNHFLQDGKIVHYSYANYFGKDLPYLGDEQLNWLSRDLALTQNPVVFFSHQSLEDRKYGIKDRASFLEVVKNSGRRILICINGHDHVDDLRRVDGIYYMELNSISNHWLGTPFARRVYGDAVHDQFPILEFTAPYRDPLFAIFTLYSDGRIEIEGRSSEFVGPPPAQRGHSGYFSGKKCTAQIRSRIIPAPYAKG